MAIALTVTLCGDTVLLIVAFSSESNTTGAWWRASIALAYATGAHGFFFAEVELPYGGQPQVLTSSVWLEHNFPTMAANGRTGLLYSTAFT